MGRRRGFEGRLGNAVAIAAFLMLAAVLLWIPAIVLVDAGDCPPGPRTGEGRYEPMGLDDPRSLWPPGVDCTKVSASAEQNEVAEIFPGASWVLASLVGGAVLVLLGGVLAEIRELRRDGGASAAPSVRRAS